MRQAIQWVIRIAWLALIIPCILFAWPFVRAIAWIWDTPRKDGDTLIGAIRYYANPFE